MPPFIRASRPARVRCPRADPPLLPGRRRSAPGCPMRPARPHRRDVVGHREAARPAPAPADREQFERLDEAVDLLGTITRVEHHREQPARAREVAREGFVARAVGQLGMQHRGDLGTRLQPLGQRQRAAAVCLEAQPHVRQVAQDQRAVVGRHAQAGAHARQLEPLVDRALGRDGRAHQHVAAARLVLGERLHRDVDAVLEGLEREARRIGVVDRGDHAALARHRRDGPHVGHFHGHRARRLQPQQAGFGADQLGDAGADQRIVEAHADAEIARQPVAEIGVGAVGIVRDQHVVAALHDAEIDVHDRRQPRGLQQRVRAALDHGQLACQFERGGRGVQAVAPLVVLAPVERAHRRQIGEHHGRGARHRRDERGPAGGQFAFGLDDAGLEGARRRGIGHMRERKQGKRSAQGSPIRGA